MRSVSSPEHQEERRAVQFVNRLDDGEVATLRSSAGQVDGRDQYIDAYWKFYLTKHRRQELLPLTSPFDGRDTNAMPRGNLELSGGA